MIIKLPGYSKDLDQIKNWKNLYLEKHPRGKRILIIWTKNKLEYYDDFLNKLDSSEFFEISFALKYALINSNLKGEWIFDTIFDNSICTITDFDEKSTLDNLFGILEYKIRRHSLITLYKGIPKKNRKIEICYSKKIKDIGNIEKDPKFNNIIKSEDSYSFCSENLRILI